MAGFYEAIKKVEGIVYDIGTGSGILSAWAVPYANFIYAVEADSAVANKTRPFLNGFKNIFFIEGDARKVHFPQKADFIICEMLDTALIDEEQVPVLNSVLKYLKKNGDVIPRGIINAAEPVHMEAEHICYQENESSLHYIMGPLKVYSQYDFRTPINPLADFQLHLKIDTNGIFNGLKITSFTLITPKIICGPTPMLNPPLMIPTEKLRVKKGDVVKIKLSYQMGGGLNSVRIETEGIS
ncbi:MAG: ribosomal protein L11 methyltransferase [Methanobacterium sp. PtaU1.Bin242]|nr:MAG: ribosomal protein L11 methyltransferase [Methanobacterium sp. PtaU1.Bin242]